MASRTVDLGAGDRTRSKSGTPSRWWVTGLILLGMALAGCGGSGGHDIVPHGTTPVHATVPNGSGPAGSGVTTTTPIDSNPPAQTRPGSPVD
jgi:hypothetical protein